MTQIEVKLDVLPQPYRDGFGQLARTLRELANDDLIALSAFGGWLVGDPFFTETPARSVAVLRRIDVKMLDRLASAGARLGHLNLRAPLIMTPEYITSSCDVFPLELLEIQQLHALVCGAEHFADLTFDRNDMRLQCERELKSELIQLRQGLLAAAGRHKLLAAVCLASAERTVRILRGVLHMAEPAETVKLAHELVKRVAAILGEPLATLQRLVSGGQEVGMVEFEGYYGELAALAARADAWDGASGEHERWP